MRSSLLLLLVSLCSTSLHAQATAPDTLAPGQRIRIRFDGEVVSMHRSKNLETTRYDTTKTVLTEIGTLNAIRGDTLQFQVGTLPSHLHLRSQLRSEEVAHPTFPRTRKLINFAGLGAVGGAAVAVIVAKLAPGVDSTSTPFYSSPKHHAKYAVGVPVGAVVGIIGAFVTRNERWNTVADQPALPR